MSRNCLSFLFIVIVVTCFFVSAQSALAGTAYTWGWNEYGQLGDGTIADRYTPQAVPGLASVHAIAAGRTHTAVIMDTGRVKTWGWNREGQLGDGTTTERHTPVDVTHSGVYNMRAIYCGYDHTIAITGPGSYMTWGWNRDGQLGDGTTIDRHSPVYVLAWGNPGGGVSAADHTVARYATNSVQVCGDNQKGALGLGDTTDRVLPRNLSGTPIDGTIVAGIAAGGYHTLFVTTGGIVYACGGNSGGQLGDGGTKQSLTPKSIIGGAKQVAAGGMSSYALMIDGTVKSWGSNSGGELGHGDTAIVYSPTEIPGLTGVKEIVAGTYFVFFIMEDGTVKACGWNRYGELGDGTTTNRHSPVTISALNNVEKIAAGTFHSIALFGDAGPAPTPVSPGDPINISINIESIDTISSGYYAYSIVTLPGGAIMTVWNSSISPFKGPIATVSGLPNGYSGTLYNGTVPSMTGAFLFEVALVPCNLPQSRANATYYGSYTLNVQ